MSTTERGEAIEYILSDFACTIEGEALPEEIATFRDRILALLDGEVGHETEPSAWLLIVKDSDGSVLTTHVETREPVVAHQGKEHVDIVPLYRAARPEGEEVKPEPSPDRPSDGDECPDCTGRLIELEDDFGGRIGVCCSDCDFDLYDADEWPTPQHGGESE